MLHSTEIRRTAIESSVTLTAQGRLTHQTAVDRLMDAVTLP